MEAAFFLAQLVALLAGGALLLAIGGRNTGMLPGLFVPSAWLLGTGMLAAERLVLAQLNLGWGWPVLTAPWLVVAGIAAYRWLTTPHAAEKRQSPSPTARIVDLAAALLVVAWTAFLWWRTTHQTLDGWDAWGIWFLKGRAFFDTGTVPTAFLTNPSYASYAHLDYPLLVPLTIAQTYSFTGDAEMLMKGWWALLAGATAAGIYWGLDGLASRAARFAGLLMVLTLPELLKHAAGELTGYADLPMAMLALYGAIFLYRWLKGGTGTDFGAAAAFFGLAGFTKNEGLPVAAAGLVMLFGLAIAQRRLRWEAFWALGLAAFALLPWQIEKLVLAIKGDINPTASGIAAHTGERIGPIMAGLLNSAIYLQRFNLIAPMLLLLGVIALLIDPRRWLASVPVLVLIIVQVCAATIAYIVSPYDLAWHIDTSVDRVVFQMTLIGLFLITIYLGLLLDTVPALEWRRKLAPEPRAHRPIPM